MNGSLRAFLSSLRVHCALTLARPTFQIVLVLQPIIMTTISYMIYRRTASAAALTGFVVLGAGIAGVWSSIVFSSAGDINRERFYGTLPAFLQSPTTLFVVMLGKLAANSLLSALSLVVGMLYATAVLRIPLAIADLPAFGLALLLFLLGANLFALTLSCLFLISRATTVLQNFLEYPILIVAGIFFPPDRLPSWARWLGWPVPLTWGAQALRAAAQPGTEPAFTRLLAINIGLITSYLVLAILLFRVIERRVRVTASLEIV